MRWALALLVLSGCTCPTSPTVLTERQARIVQYTQCFADYKGLGLVEVYFYDDLDGAAARAGIESGFVKYHNESVESGQDWYLRAVAAHEVCHLTGLWGEEEADQCANEMLKNGVCP